MLRQIKRVVKFWREYCGKKPVNRIDDKVLSDYVEWRKDYYHRMPPHLIPQNARLNPADKTLAWEIGLGKSLLKFAHERGYRGKAQLPTWNFRRVKKIVRPAFTIAEYATIYHGFRSWIREVPHEYQELGFLVFLNLGLRRFYSYCLRIGMQDQKPMHGLQGMGSRT